MLININDTQIDVRFSIAHFCAVVDYKKRYESEATSLGKYLVQLQSEAGIMDAVMDAIFYSHAIEEREKGRRPLLSYADVAMWVMSNPDKLQEIAALFAESMPKPTEPETAKEVSRGKKK